MSNEIIFSFPFEAGLLLYLGLLMVIFSKITPSLKNNLTLSLSVLTAQYLLTFFFYGVNGYNGWLLFSLILGRFLGVYHPPVLYERPLSTGRKILGWIALLIFILSFSPKPFIFS